ncbi:MAG: heme NO-binding domain-containing protein [Porticoccaceae bacterium]|nr:heme NO-binding domain-containing protein [Porticoccaceae bacterium]
MKGLIFTSFLHLVEKEYGLEMVDKVIAQAAPPSGGIYTTVGNYDHREVIAMIAALSKNINLSVGHLTKTFGVYLFAELIAAYPQWITNFNSSFALLSKVDGFIHGEVKKLYPDASPPSFKCTHYSETRMQVIYQSPRCMGDVAEGLILGCAAYYQEKITVRRETIDDGSGSSERFLLKRVAGSNATTSEP